MPAIPLDPVVTSETGVFVNPNIDPISGEFAPIPIYNSPAVYPNDPFIPLEDLPTYGNELVVPLESQPNNTIDLIVGPIREDVVIPSDNPANSSIKNPTTVINNTTTTTIPPKGGLPIYGGGISSGGNTSNDANGIPKKKNYWWLIAIAVVGTGIYIYKKKK